MAEDKLSPHLQVGRKGVTPRRLNCTASGNNILVAVTAGQRIKLYRASLTVNADITGEVKLLIGSTEVGGVYNPKTGGQYVLMSAAPDYEIGAGGEDLILNLPSEILVTVNATYELIG